MGFHQIKMCNRPKWTFLKRRHTDGKQLSKIKLSPTDHHGNANENLNKFDKGLIN
jgi:hypothetical protein